jgi:hypothetical protein
MYLHSRQILYEDVGERQVGDDEEGERDALLDHICQGIPKLSQLVFLTDAPAEENDENGVEKPEQKRESPQQAHPAQRLWSWGLALKQPIKCGMLAEA